MWASRVVALAILSLGLPMSPFVMLYCRGVSLLSSWVMSCSARSSAYVRPSMLLV